MIWVVCIALLIDVLFVLGFYYAGLIKSSIIVAFYSGYLACTLIGLIEIKIENDTINRPNNDLPVYQITLSGE